MTNEKAVESYKSSVTVDMSVRMSGTGGTVLILYRILVLFNLQWWAA